MAPKVYLLDEENKVRSWTLTREMTVGPEGSDMVALGAAEDFRGQFFPQGSFWYYRQLGGVCSLTDQGKSCLLSAPAAGRLRMGGMGEKTGAQAVQLHHGAILISGDLMAYFSFLDAPGTWARTAVTGEICISPNSSMPVSDREQAAAVITAREGGFVLSPRKPDAVKYQGEKLISSVSLGTNALIEVGSQVFFWRDGVLHYLSTAPEAATTFHINRYGGGIRIRPAASAAPKTAESVPTGDKTPTGGLVMPATGGIRIERPKAVSPVPEKTPSAAPIPPNKSLSPEDAARVKAVAMARAATPEEFMGKTIRGAALPRRFTGRPGGLDTLKISIRERSVRNLLTKKILLKDISLEVRTGEMVLILGGSGAGKTTFMNAVMGYEPADGTISFKGMNVYQEYEKMKYMIGFVPQQDLMRDSDTVYETLKNAGEMKMPASTTPERLEARVTEVLGLMGLEAERDNLVKKLSGGQRKRLSIGQEYIGDPTLFFLDEPDSGLDGGMAKSLMEKLRTIADTKKIVMLISHQPDRTSELFDKVIVLAKSNTEGCGRLCFYGSVEETKAFFGVAQLEQVVQKINRKDEGGEGLSDYFIEKFARERG